MRWMAIPLKLANGNEIYLAPGKHGDLQRAVIEKFVPRYIPDTTILYLGDVTNKFLVYKQERLGQLSVPIFANNMLTDIIFHHAEKNWLYLIKTGTFYGCISHRRLREMEKFLERCSAKRIYISVFSTIAEYRRSAKHIAWGSHVWIAEIPEHTIHHD